MTSVAPTPSHTPVRRRAGRVAGGLVAGLVLALAVLLPGAAPAGAAGIHRTEARCTVKLGSRSALVAAADRSDAVFAAKVTSVRKVRVRTSGVVPPTYWRHTVRVVASFRGSARARGVAHLVLTPLATHAGKALTKGATYLFFADQRSAAFSAPRCGGTVLLRHGLTSSLRTRLTADLSSSGSQGVAVHLSGPTGSVRDLPHLGRLLAPGAALVLIGVLGLFLVGRLGRERA